LSFPLDGVGQSILFRHTRALVDVKTKSCDDKYPAALGDPVAVAKKRQKEVNDDYPQRAKKLDEKLGTAASVKGPFANELNQYEHLSYYSDKPSDAKAMFSQQLYRSLGLTAHLGWARLLIDRYRDLVLSPPQPASNISTTGLTTSPPTTKMHSRTSASSIPTPHTPNLSKPLPGNVSVLAI
jgi:hypothetical protein